ncbi:histone-lysine N-methyltransferase SETMAR [Trichonephila clavipes]|nr:histone-lysine N-methyltransferase SETMAR [Trichonephila clavipes]
MNIISNSSKIKYPSTKSTVLFVTGQERSRVLQVAEIGKTINLYYNQLDKLNAVIEQKRSALAFRKGIVFHQDNARPHTAMVTHQKLNALGWEVLGHPPYSSDITPSDYYLFRSMQNYLLGKNSSFESVSKAVVGYFNSKDENFYKTGIHRLPERWQQVVTNNGAYVIY